MLSIKKINNKIFIKRATSISLLSILSLGLFYVLFSPLIISNSQNITPESISEGLLSFFSPFSSFQTATAATLTSNTIVSVTVTKEVTVTSPATLALTGSIGGITGGTALGTATFQVLSSSEAGFTMTLKASAAPALGTGSYYFSDYAPLASATPDSTWTAPAAGTTSFGFAVSASGSSGADASQKFKFNTTCNVAGGTNSTANCWAGFTGVTPVTVVSTSAFSAATVSENIAFKAGFTTNGIVAIPADTYTATVTATVAVN